MSVVIVNDFGFVEGGASQVAFQHAEILANADVEVALLVGQFAPNSLIKGWVFGKHKMYSLGGRSIADKKNVGRYANGLWNRSVKSALKQVVEAVSEPPVLLVHSWTKIISPSIFRAAKEMKLRVVLMAHDYVRWCPNGAYYNYMAEENCQLKPLSAACLSSRCDRDSVIHKAWRILRAYITNLVARSYGKIVFVSDFQRRVVEEFEQKFGEGAYVLQNRAMALKPSKATYTDELKFVYIGRVTDEKAPGLFLSAVRMADQKGVLIGGQLDMVPGDVENLPWATSKQVADLLNGDRVLVFPSVWRETFGLIVYEAASLGVPAIVSSSSAPADFIVHGESGLIFESGSVESLAECISIMAQDKEKRMEMGEAAKKAFAEHDRANSEYAQQLLSIVFGNSRGKNA